MASKTNKPDALFTDLEKQAADFASAHAALLEALRHVEAAGKRDGVVFDLNGLRNKIDALADEIARDEGRADEAIAEDDARHAAAAAFTVTTTRCDDEAPALYRATVKDARGRTVHTVARVDVEDAKRAAARWLDTCYACGEATTGACDRTHEEGGYLPACPRHSTAPRFLAARANGGAND